MYNLTFARKSLLLLTVKIVFVALLIAPITASADYEGSPVTQERLETVLRGKQLSTGQIVDSIRRKGVNFQLTSEIERRLISAGARPQVLEAIRQNFREAIAAAPVNAAPGGSLSSSNSANNKSFSGAPLTKDAVIVLLQNGVAVAQVQKNIGARGVNFQMNPEIAKEIKAAGGSDALVGTIFGAYIAPANAEVAGGGSASAAGKPAEKSESDPYEDLINRANESYASNTGRDSPGIIKSIELLNQAAALDRSNPRAYQGLGFQKLYGVNADNFGEVEGLFKKPSSLAATPSSAFTTTTTAFLPTFAKGPSIYRKIPSASSLTTMNTRSRRPKIIFSRSRPTIPSSK